MNGHIHWLSPGFVSSLVSYMYMYMYLRCLSAYQPYKLEMVGSNPVQIT